MPTGAYKKPSLTEFKKVLAEVNGSLTNAAQLLGCSRQSIWVWGKDDPDFAEAVKESRKRILDRCITTAQALAFGIPEMEDGKVVGWKERPDPNMLRFFMQTLGRDEGFGDALDVTSNGKDISSAIQVEIIDRREDVDAEDTDDENL